MNSLAVARLTGRAGYGLSVCLPSPAAIVGESVLILQGEVPKYHHDLVIIGHGRAT
jgi:hypothetical protein